MIIAVPKELKNQEHRVALTPDNVRTLTEANHKVLIQSDAGAGLGFSDEHYHKSGAEIIKDIEKLWDRADMVIKVKEPIEQEYQFFKKDLILYTFLHLAAEPKLTQKLLDCEVIAIAYETIELPDGSLPLLRPMSEITGRIAPQIGAALLQKHHGVGKGILLGGVTGVSQGHVVIIGAGVVGFNAAKIAMGLGAKVTILDKDLMRLNYVENMFGSRCQTIVAHPGSIALQLVTADLVICSVLLSGAKAPQIITSQMIKSMQPGSVIMDIAIDQGGSVQKIKPTTHVNPVYNYNDVLLYGVTNIPGCVPKTSSYALTNVSFFYALEIANHGLEKAMKIHPALQKGLNTIAGHLTHRQISLAHNLKFCEYKFS